MAHFDVLMSFLMHPVVLVVEQIFTTALIVGFTKPFSPLRLAILPLQALVLWLISEQYLQAIPAISVATVVAGNAPKYVLHYLDVALLSKWTFEAKGPATCSGSRRTDLKKTDDARVQTSNIPFTSTNTRARLMFGLNTTVSQRHARTPYEVKNVPYFSSTNPQFVPSRRKFIQDSLTKILVCFFIIDVVGLRGPPENASELIGPNKIPVLSRLTEISGGDILIRFTTTSVFWLTIFCMFRMLYGLLAVVTVSLGWYDVQDWRPPFGSLSEAWSVRRFWG